MREALARIEPRARLLLVEDEPTLVTTLVDRLGAEGYAVEAVRDGETALTRLAQASFDLVLLDVMLPRRDGYDVCRGLRMNGLSLPVLMLTARALVQDRVIGLKLGADDYLVKPFDMGELLARVEALLRRGRVDLRRTSVFTFGDVRVDFPRAEVVRGRHVVALSSTEFRLLGYLIEHRGQLLTRHELLHQVWGHQGAPRSRTVDVHVASLRQKLERLPNRPEFILTVHGQGYRFAA